MTEPLVLPTLRHYRAGWLVADLAAGLTLVAIAVPEQMATARLANMPAVTGLYAFVAGSLVFALLGRSPRVSVGADSTIAPILAAGVVAIAATGTSRYGQLLSFLALMVGGLLAVIGLLRLGWISEFLSAPVVTGVLAGIAVEIFVRQLPAVLGIPGGGTTTIARVRAVVDQLDSVNGWAVAIASGVLVVILVSERVDRRLPGALIGLIGSTLLVSLLSLGSHGVATLGSLHGGLPVFSVPSASWADIRMLIGPALTVAFICVAQTAATVRASSDGTPTAEDFDRDLLAIGAGSLLAGVSGSFAVNSSPPRSAVVAASGGRSQLAGLVAAGLAFVVALAATGLMHDLPQATLGAILIYVATRLFRVGELASVLRFDRIEFALAIVTLSITAILGIEQGVAVAMLLSLAERTWRVARPPAVILGREPGTDHWIPPDVGRPTEQVPGVVVYLMYAPLWYGNANYVRARILQIVGESSGPVRAFVLDADGMSDIDYTGTRTLAELAATLQRQGVTLALARTSHLIHRELKHSGLLQQLGSDKLFASVEDAVAVLSGES